jgi:long-chain acyl-CoA synthetase
VLANGEKVPPADMELAIAGDPLFEQVMVVGEAYLAVLVVLSDAAWLRLAASLEVDSQNSAVISDPRVQQVLLDRVASRLRAFPGYAQVRRVLAFREPWEVADGLLTATLKLRRKQVAERFRQEIEDLYAGH